MIAVTARLRMGSAAARFLVLWVLISPEAWVSVSCVCCVLLRANHSCRGVLPVVVCLSVTVMPL